MLIKRNDKASLKATCQIGKLTKLRRRSVTKRVRGRGEGKEEATSDTRTKAVSPHDSFVRILVGTCASLEERIFVVILGKFKSRIRGETGGPTAAPTTHGRGFGEGRQRVRQAGESDG